MKKVMMILIPIIVILLIVFGFIIIKDNKEKNEEKNNNQTEDKIPASAKELSEYIYEDSDYSPKVYINEEGKVVYEQPKFKLDENENKIWQKDIDFQITDNSLKEKAKYLAVNQSCGSVGSLAVVTENGNLYIQESLDETVMEKKDWQFKKQNIDFKVFGIEDKTPKMPATCFQEFFYVYEENGKNHEFNLNSETEKYELGKSYEELYDSE